MRKYFRRSKRYRKRLPKEVVTILLVFLGIGFVIAIIRSLVSLFKSNPVLYGILFFIVVGTIVLIVYLRRRKKRYDSNNEKSETIIEDAYDDYTSEENNQDAYDHYTFKTNNYEKKNIMTENERMYWGQLQRLYGDNYIITPQIPLSSIVQKSSGRYAGELYRTIDFGIFTKNSYELKALIEINDKSHFQNDRVERDRKVKEILEEAGLYDKLVTIWTYESHDDYDIMQKLRYLL